MEEALESTTPFMTIDPMVSDRLESVYSALLGGGDWKSLIASDEELKERLQSQGVENPEDRDSIKWDDANIFFLSCVALSPIGQPLPLEAGISKERFGRFPFGNGSALSYLREIGLEIQKGTQKV